MVVLSESDLVCNDHGDQFYDVGFDDVNDADDDNHDLIPMTCEKVVQALLNNLPLFTEWPLGLKDDDDDDDGGGISCRS